jgi:hypothetical protein
MVGTKTDMLIRTESVARNTYNSENGYNKTNVNALSDGDEKGKGQIGDEGKSIGSKTDINERLNNTTKNSYGEKKPYDRHPTI